MTRRDETKTALWFKDLQNARLPNVFNPWGEQCEYDATENAFKGRAQRLLTHLSCHPKLICIGEAPGYQGARYSGIPFTSERLLIEGAVPRIGSMQGVRLSSRNRPFSEPSATIMWGALYECGVAEHTVLWNAFPWHPMKDGPHTNRTPTRDELRAGLPVLEGLLGLFPSATVVAVGQKSAASLKLLGVNIAACVRHPAMGGASEFRAGISTLFSNGGF